MTPPTDVAAERPAPPTPAAAATPAAELELVTGPPEPALPRALGPWPLLMRNPVRTYDWGSRTALAKLQGRDPSGEPEAELWMGAHPSAPSLLVTGGGREHPLDLLVEHRAADLLGARVHARFGDRLPFLLKVLAIARPLSLQVHPGAERARAGYRGEVEVLDGHRYVDPYAKPELLYALDVVDALCGFRPATQVRRLVELLGSERCRQLLEPLTAGDAPDRGLEGAFRHLVDWPAADRAALSTEVTECARAALADAEVRAQFATVDRDLLGWVIRLAEAHPGDALVAAPLLLELVRLRPGETLFVPAGTPHAYLHGLGVEVMGNSDNVLRAGLTHKPIAIGELLEVVDGRTRPIRDIHARRVSPHEMLWAPPAAEFALSRIRPTGPAPVAAYPGLTGPQIVLCTRGPVSLTCSGRRLRLAPGESAFVGASGGGVTVSGPGEVFRAFTGLGQSPAANG